MATAATDAVKGKTGNDSFSGCLGVIGEEEKLCGALPYSSVLIIQIILLPFVGPFELPATTNPLTVSTNDVT